MMRPRPRSQTHAHDRPRGPVRRRFRNRVRGPLVAGILTATLMVAACATGPPSPPEADWPELPAGATAEQFERIEAAHTANSGFDQARYEGIRSSDRWAAWWEDFQGRRSPTAERPEVDFQREIVIGAVMGQRVTGGVEISVEGVYRAEDRLIVRVLETSPGPGCMVTQAVTSPATAVRVPLPAARVVFEEIERTVHCD